MYVKQALKAMIIVLCKHITLDSKFTTDYSGVDRALLQYHKLHLAESEAKKNMNNSDNSADDSEDDDDDDRASEKKHKHKTSKKNKSRDARGRTTGGASSPVCDDNHPKVESQKQFEKRAAEEAKAQAEKELRAEVCYIYNYIYYRCI